MKQQSTNTLVQVSGILLILGVVIIDPRVGVFGLGLGALFTLPGIIIGTKVYRVIAIILLVLNLAFLAIRFPEAYRYNGKTEVTEFCNSVKNGDAYEDTRSIAVRIGEDNLRKIRDEFIIVGYKGNLPFPNKLCRIDFIEGKVSDVHFYSSK